MLMFPDEYKSLQVFFDLAPGVITVRVLCCAAHPAGFKRPDKTLPAQAIGPALLAVELAQVNPLLQETTDGLQAYAVSGIADRCAGQPAFLARVKGAVAVGKQTLTSRQTNPIGMMSP